MTAQSELQAQLRDQVSAAAQGVLDRQAEAASAEEQAPEPEAPAAAEPTPAPEGEQAPEPTAETVVPATEAPTGTVAEEDVPTTYYGHELPGTAEERKSIIEALSGRDKHIQQLLRDKAEQAKAEAEAPAAPAAPAAPEPPAEVTDEAILSELGINPEHEDMSDPRIQAIVGLARFSLDLKTEVGALSQGVAVRETEALWNTQLDALEGQYGALPPDITRDDVLEHAAKAGIAEPVDAYWRIMGPARAEVLTAVQARRDAAETALKRGSSSPVKPRSEAELAPAPLEATNTKDAVKEVMLRLEKSGRFNFGTEQ